MIQTAPRNLFRAPVATTTGRSIRSGVLIACALIGGAVGGTGGFALASAFGDVTGDAGQGNMRRLMFDLQLTPDQCARLADAAGGMMERGRIFHWWRGGPDRG